jgi:hypothetical protein
MAQLLPFVNEMILVDAGSTDNSQDFYQGLNRKIKLLSHPMESDNLFFPYDALGTFALSQCDDRAKKIVKFHADDVWDTSLIKSAVESPVNYQKVFRIQVWQNFQRIKQYPWPFMKIVGSNKLVCHSDDNFLVGQDDFDSSTNTDGYLWDVSGNFWENSRYGRSVEEHPYVREATSTFLKIPEILAGLIGKHRYEVREEVLSKLR